MSYTHSHTEWKKRRVNWFSLAAVSMMRVFEAMICVGVMTISVNRKPFHIHINTNGTKQIQRILPRKLSNVYHKIVIFFPFSITKKHQDRQF